MNVVQAVDTRQHHLEKELDAAGWGLLLIWCGLALFAHLGWGVALIGIGVIVLGAQVLRRSVGLKAEGFSIVMGTLFLAGGAWEQFGIQIGLVPAVCVAAGLLLLASAIRGYLSDRRASTLR